MCGGNDFMKHGGLFECQNCGVKYSVEEARNLMIDGTVEVKGTVKVDNTTKLDNLYQIARRAKGNDNIDQAFKYYEQLIVEDPNSWEANFYVAYFSAMQKCRNGEIIPPINIIVNSLDSVFDLIEFLPDEKKQNSAALEIKYKVDNISELLLKTIEHEYNVSAERISNIETGIMDNPLAGGINMFKKSNLKSQNRYERDAKLRQVADMRNLLEQRKKRIEYENLNPVEQKNMEKQEEQSMNWSEAGLCQFCGGALSFHNYSTATLLRKLPWSLDWTERKCKSCGKINLRSYEEAKRVKSKKTTNFIIQIVVIVVVFLILSAL